MKNHLAEPVLGYKVIV